MSNKFNFHNLKATERLPSPSGTALAIVKLVQRDDATIPQIAQLIKMDPALSGRILRFVNSAAFGARRPIVDIQDAVLSMGMQAVRNFTLSLSLISNNSTGKCSAFDYAAYWAQTLAMATATAAITARERTMAPEESFTLGLLSDIGRLAFATAWPESYSSCLEAEQGEQLLVMEKEKFGIDHKELSLILLEDWGLPELFLEALRSRFDQDKKYPPRVTRLASQLDFARQIACYCLADEGYRAFLFTELITQASLHNFSEIELMEFVSEVIDEWHDWGKLIEVNTTVQISLPEAVSAEVILSDLDLLLIGDDSKSLTDLSRQLIKSGHRVGICCSSESALQYVIENKPQMVIINGGMESIGELALCKLLRTSNFGKNLYLIMCTANDNEDAQIAAFDAGIDDYIINPVSLRVLLVRIRAGHRTVVLQQELEKESRDIQHYTVELAAANRRLRILANTHILTS